MTDSLQWQRTRAQLLRFLQRQTEPSRLTSVADDLGLSMPTLREHLAQLQGVEWVETIERVELTAAGRLVLAANFPPEGAKTMEEWVGVECSA